MSVKLHTHKVTIIERRRANKIANDMLKSGVSGRTFQATFNKYYKDPVKALYSMVTRAK